MSEPQNYGDRYWCVKTDLSKNGEIYVFADRVEIQDNGDIVFFQITAIDHPINLAISKNHWTCFYRASIMDGSAAAVQHWEGEAILTPVERSADL